MASMIPHYMDLASHRLLLREEVSDTCLSTGTIEAITSKSNRRFHFNSSSNPRLVVLKGLNNRGAILLGTYN